MDGQAIYEKLEKEEQKAKSLLENLVVQSKKTIHRKEKDIY